jgi:hypothetical protein
MSSDIDKRGKRCNEKRLHVLRYLYSNPCVDCGWDDPVVLDFDHMEHLGTKTANISNLINSNHSLETLKKEMAKCVIRCANCHRKKTARDNNSYRLIPLERFERIVDSMPGREIAGNASKLNLELAREIRRRYRIEKLGYKKLAKEYGVHRTTIKKIVLGLTYRE